MLYHPDPTQYIEEASDFGALGSALVSLSNLEFAHDEFVFKVHEQNKELSLRLSKSFPRHFKKKTDFLVDAVWLIPKLRQVPMFVTGELNLQWLQYQLDELYEIRLIFAHGSVFLSETSEDRITWTFERFVSNRRNTWEREAVKISNGFLASVSWSAETIKQYIYALLRTLEGNSSWEREYQADKEIRSNRLMFAELKAFDVFGENVPSEFDFPPLGPIE